MVEGDCGSDCSYSFTSYANYTVNQCLAIPDPSEQVLCEEQMLNITNPPSVYGYLEYTQLWEPVSCLLWNVTLSERVDLEGAFNYCTVPLRGSDGFLFVSLALLATALLFGKLSAVWVLIAGGILGCMNYYVNMLEISNSIAIWLSIQPADLFFYAFLPPLLVDQAIRIDFFMFRKIWVHSLLMAFVMVILSAIILTPLILFVLGFQARGWSWVHGALFSAIISPTDALAVAAILARANGPERLVAIMEGECLFNDASAITLFEIFAHLVYEHSGALNTDWPSVWSVIPTILLDIVRLTGVGIAIGLAMSIATGYILRWLRWRGARPYIETTVVLSVAYLSFYIATAPAGGSGVIAVVVFGLYGNFTSKWGMLASAEESGAFDAVWDMISFSANGLVFFWSGIASINFLIRSIVMFDQSLWSFLAVPFIYIFMLIIRCGCVALFNPVFRMLGEGLSAADIAFVGWAGLRGSVSLIMVSAFATGSRLTFMNTTGNADDAAVVNSEISFWTACFVVLTLVINGPTIAPMLRLLRLNRVPVEKRKMRARAKRALCRYTEEQIATLREDEDQFLQGANWEAVGQYVDMSKYLKDFDMPLSDTDKDSNTASDDLKTKRGVLTSIWRAICQWCVRICCCWRRQKPSGGGGGGVQVGEGKSRRGSQSDLGDSNIIKKPPGDGDDGPFFNVPISKVAELDTPDGSSSDQSQEPWAEATARELALELADQCPFLPERSSGIPTLSSSKEAEKSASGSSQVLSVGDVDVELGLERSPSVASPKAMPKPGSGSNLASIVEGQAAVYPPLPLSSADVDQECLTGPAGAKLLTELRRALTTDRTSNAPLPDYYSTVQGELGAHMQLELAVQLRQGAGAGGGEGGSIAASGAAAVEEIEAPQYYSSLPTIAGRHLQEELQKALKAQKQQDDASTSNQLLSPSPSNASPAAAAVQQVQVQVQEQQLVLDAYSSLPVSARNSLQQELKRHLSENSEGLSSLPCSTSGTDSPFAAQQQQRPRFDATTSMPANVGRALKAQLQERVAPTTKHTRSGSMSSTISSGLGTGSQHSSRPTASVDWDSYSATISGVTGANLAAEVSRRLRLPVPAPGLQDDKPRDLLGRKIGRGVPGLPQLPTSGSQHSRSQTQDQVTPRAAVRATTETPVAAALLKKRSHAHPLLRSITAQERQPPAGRVPASHSVDDLEVLQSQTEIYGGLRQLRPVQSARGRQFGSPVGVEGSTAQKAANGPSTTLLTRTFSVGASLHQMKSIKRDIESEAPAGEGDGDGEPLTREALPRTTSAMTIVDGSDHQQSDDERVGNEEEDPDAAQLAEMRTRLLGGLKRHFLAKRIAGLLSVEGLRVLQYVCDKAADDASSPLRLWAALEREVGGRWGTRLASRLSLSGTRGYRALPSFLQRCFAWPYKQFASALRRYLGWKMLVACEVAVEYYLALTNSHQIQFLKGHVEECWRLLEEVEADGEAAHKFIIEKEIEAPDRFQAIQSYRAAMAVLRHQKIFADYLFETGMVDEGEHHSLLDPIDKKSRHLEIVGPVWRPAGPRQVLRGLPFTAILSEVTFKSIWESGNLQEFKSGQCIWTATNLVRHTGGMQGPGSFVVLSGVVKRVYIHPNGVRKEYFQSAGGVVGVLLCMTGTKLPGSEMAIAEGNTLGKGPVVFHVPQAFSKRIQDLAAEGDEEMAKLEEELFRLSAAYVVENMEPDIVGAVTAHMSAVINPVEKAAAGDGDSDGATTGAGDVPRPQVVSRRNTSTLHSQNNSSKVLQQMPATASDHRRSTMPSSANATAPSSGMGLVSSKSVGVNMAAMMQHIAQLEYSDDESDAEEVLHMQQQTSSSRKSLEGRGSKLSETEAQFEGDEEQGGAAAAAAQQRSPSPRRRTVHFQNQSSASLNANRAAMAIAAAKQHAPAVAADVALEIKRGLHSAFVLRLAPGDMYVQTSHTVLIAGHLDPVQLSAECLNAAAPAILPWLWHGAQLCNLGACITMVERLEWKVGSERATLVVCHQLDGTVPPAVVDWETRLVDRQRLLAHTPPTGLASFPLASSTNGAHAGNEADEFPRVPSTASGSEQGSLVGAAAASMGRELGTMLSRMRRTRPA